MPLEQSKALTILIAEDDELVAAQLRINLELVGVTNVAVVSNGLDALETMNERGREIDVVFCDLNMPEMNGIELINSLGELNHQAKIVLISGSDKGLLQGSARIADARGLDVLGVLEKPIEVVQLKDLVDQFVNSTVQEDL